ncbi:MAG: hypothetical protein JXK95_12240 [Bacteroidales bacterium]|nr:hypothetical protein [Bacteroidales bacterium]
MQSTIINDRIQVIQGDDQIYRYIAINNCSIDMDTLEKMTRVGDSWNGTRLCANLIDIRNMMFIDSKTRAYAAAQYRAHVAGTAIIVDSKISSYFANIYLKFSQPKVPTRLFTNDVDAEKWLKEQMQKRIKAGSGA